MTIMQSMDFQLIDSGWNRVIEEALTMDHSSLRIICPFIKRGTAERLLKMGRPQTIQVITRFNLRDFCDGVSDTAALQLLLEHGAKIRGVRNLHAKLYLFGERRVVVTSANLTDAALLRNHEFGFVAQDAGILRSCRKYFDDLWMRAGEDLTGARLQGWAERVSIVWAGGSRPSLAAGLLDEGVNAGVTEPPIVLPPSVVDAPQSFVKFFGANKTRGTRDRLIIDELKRAGCHWACAYPKDKRPRQVNDGDIIFISLLVKKTADIIIHGRAVAMSHVPERDDATAADIQKRDWKEKWPHYIRVHDAEFVAGKIGNGVSLNEMMAALKSDSFATTQRNAAKKNGNTDPRKAYKRQPAVELSEEGFKWLNDKLEAAFRQHGKLASSELEGLDWPEIPIPSPYVVSK